MPPLHRARRFRGFLAATLLAAVVGARFDHHHADHDATLHHLEEDHGSHGESVAPAVERLPAGGLGALPTSAVQAAVLPDLLDPVWRRAAEPDRNVRPVGHDPPAARGSRAPPASPQDTRRTA